MDAPAAAPAATCAVCNHEHKADGTCDCNCDAMTKAADAPAA